MKLTFVPHSNCLMLTAFPQLVYTEKLGMPTNSKHGLKIFVPLFGRAQVWRSVTITNRNHGQKLASTEGGVTQKVSGEATRMEYGYAHEE